MSASSFSSALGSSPDMLTVAELTTYIRELFETNEQLQDVWITGEVSNLSRAASGHWYFTLKDSTAQIKCVMWRTYTERQTFIPANGDSVLLHGYVSVYEAQGAYQLYGDLIRPLGIGDLYRQFEKLKAKLEAEGLFDEARKRPLPAFPRRIGVVTSAEAAAFQDIQNVLRRRFPLASVILSPCTVQGDSAPPQICAAIDRLNQHAEVDLILVIRGGGSLEDLWAFNDERVARAIAASRIPIVSGVGHETDFTIADFVADLRAPTPSAAAEQATPNIDELGLAVRGLEHHLNRLMSTNLAILRDDVGITERSLKHVAPLNRLRNLRQRVDDWTARLNSTQRSRFTLLNERLLARVLALEAANPHSILKRGYAIVYRSEDGQRVETVRDVKPGVGITIQLGDGDLKARVEDKDSHERYTRTLF